MKPFFSSLQRIADIGVGFFVLFLWMLANLYGVAYTNDSFHFVAAGRSFWQSGQWLTADGHPLAHWQPLYPSILGLFLEIPFGVLGLHFICLLTFIRGMWLLRRLHQWSFGWYAIGVCHPLLLAAFSFVWTESLSLPLLVWFLWYYEQYRISFKQKYFIPTFLLLLGLSWCRFSFLPAVYALLLYDVFFFSERRHYKLGLQLLSISFLAVGAWLIYAYYHHTTFLGNYGMWQGKWSTTFLLYLKAWGNYFAPAALNILLPVVAVGSITWLGWVASCHTPSRRFAVAFGAECFFLLFINIQSYDDQWRYLLPAWIFFVLALGNQKWLRTSFTRLYFLIWLCSLAGRCINAALLWYNIRQEGTPPTQASIEVHVDELELKASVRRK